MAAFLYLIEDDGDRSRVAGLTNSPGANFGMEGAARETRVKRGWSTGMCRAFVYIWEMDFSLAGHRQIWPFLRSLHPRLTIRPVVVDLTIQGIGPALLSWPGFQAVTIVIIEPLQGEGWQKG